MSMILLRKRVTSVIQDRKMVDSNLEQTTKTESQAAAFAVEPT